MSQVDLEAIVSGTFDDVPDDVEAPVGTYVLEVIRTEFGVSTGEEPKPYLQVMLKAVEVVEAEGISNDDLVNVYPLRDKMFVNAKAKKRTKQIIEGKFGIDTEGASLATIAENLLGSRVRAALTYDVKTVNGEEKKYSRLKYLGAN